jgi:hypothetical protein
MISDKRAREIAACHYAGQWSGLYKIACNEDYSNLTIDDWEQAKKEIHEEWSVGVSAGAPKRYTNSLFCLESWILRQMEMLKKQMSTNLKAGDKA